MDLREYLTVFWRRRWVIIITAVVALLVTGIGTLLVTPVYVATTTLRVTTAANPTVENIGYDNVIYADRLLNTYIKLATSGSILRELAHQLGVEKPPSVKVDVPANTELIQIAVEHPDPLLAATAANTLARILITEAEQPSNGGGKPAHEILRERLTNLERQLAEAANTDGGTASRAGDQESGGASIPTRLAEETYGRLLQQYERARIMEAIRANTIRVVDLAVVPQAPARPNKILNLAISLVAGLVGGIGLSFLLENLDTRLYTVKNIEDVSAFPIIGGVPHASDAQRSGLVTSGSSQDEVFRHLRARLLGAEGGEPPRSILVTSAEPGAGKSIIAANLAASLGQDGSQVTLVDANLRRPRVHEILGLPNKVGLSSVLSGASTLDQALQSSPFPGVKALTSGPLVPNPSELFGSRPVVALLRQLAAVSDVVVLDGPALLPVADATVLAPSVDCVLLIVARGETRKEALIAACRELTAIGAKAVGVVLNRTEADHGHAYYEGYCRSTYIVTHDVAQAASQLHSPVPSRTPFNRLSAVMTGPPSKSLQWHEIQSAAAEDGDAIRSAEAVQGAKISSDELGRGGRFKHQPGNMFREINQTQSPAHTDQKLVSEAPMLNGGNQGYPENPPAARGHENQAARDQ